VAALLLADAMLRLLLARDSSFSSAARSVGQ
jgi:hypothetical protein